MVYDVDLIVDDLAGVGHPLASHHELVVDALSERVGHTAVPAGETDPALYSPAQALLLLVRDLPHRPDRDHEVEDLATAFIRFSGGATLNLEAGWAAYRESSDDFGVTLYGTDGGAEMKVRNYGTSDTVRIYTDVAGVPAVVVPEIEPREGHYAVVRRFIETIWAGAWEGQYGEDGLSRARIIDACYASALENREVSMQEIIREEAV